MVMEGQSCDYHSLLGDGQNCVLSVNSRQCVTYVECNNDLASHGCSLDAHRLFELHV